ncbi:MAG: hypothetical protein LUH19_06030, partial [Lachnospiraceae bacterium]|nr:hypothetical protein [Lachnospiraceae bacterium]
CLVLTQIEGVARFVSARGKVSIPKEQEQRLWKMAARLVETSGRDQDALAVCLPVQVYDGLECVRTDEKGDPILHLSQDGYHQSYRPLNCQLPALYTLQTVAESDGTDFFEGMVPVRSFLGGVRQHYGQIFGAPDWQPIVCGGKEQG